jgi:poly(3-hydroxybutyrate) depolymerase
MRREFSAWLGFLALSLAAPGLSGADDPVAALPAEPKPGRYGVEMKSGGYDRTALVIVPKAYKPGAQLPLVLLLHGGGGDGAHILDKDGWAAKADKEGFLVVAPTGLPAAPRLAADFKTNPRVWNSGLLNPKSPRAAISDVVYLGALLDEVQKRVPHDRSRVFVTGHSNGAGMTFLVGAELSERFAAIAPVAGMMDVQDPKPKQPLPTLYIIGTKDPLVPLAGGEVKNPWGTKTRLPVANYLASWAKALGCETEPKTLSDKDGLKRVQYPSKSGGPKLSVVYIDGQGHTWPGGRATLPESVVGPTTDKLNATDAIWEFFEKHPEVTAVPKRDSKDDDGDRPRLSWKTPPIKANRVRYQTFDSAAAKTTISYHVYTPEAYDREKDRSFPVLYWLHGSGGGLAGVKPLTEFFDDAIRTEKIPPMLIVFPNGLASSMWCDSKDGRVPMETVVVKELVPHVDKAFRTVASREGRVIEGFSMGGYGAGRLGFLYPDTFGTVSVLAGGPLDLDFQGPRAKGNPAERERILKDTFGDDLDHYKALSPLTVAGQRAATVAGKSKVRVVVGARDNTADLNRAYSELLKKLKVEHELTVVPGVGHETMPLLKGLGEDNWAFYRAAFGKK